MRGIALSLLAIVAVTWLVGGIARTGLAEEKEPVVRQQIVMKLRDGSLLARAKAATGPQYYLCPKDEAVFLADSRREVVCPKCGSTQCVRVVDEIDRMMSRSWNFVESMRVRDKPYGYIKWSRSAYDDHNFFASYDAMCSLYKLLDLGYEPPITKEQFVEWCDTFHSWIDPKTGIVEDRLLLKRVGRTSGMFLYTCRAAGMIQTIPRLAGWKFATNPGGPRAIKMATSRTYSSRSSKPPFWNVETARKWIERVRHTNSYSFGSAVAHALEDYDGFLKDNNREDNGVIEFFHKWLDEHQDPKTGFWGSDKWPLHLGSAGYFKLVSHGGTYRRYGWKPRYRDKVIDSCLSIQDERGRFGSAGACINWDALKNLRVVAKEIGYYRWDDVRLAAARSVLTIRACWKADECGFSASPRTSCTGHCGMKLAPSRNEADMHALTIWTSIPKDILLILLDAGAREGTEKGVR
jgi:hypothetical protein